MVARQCEASKVKSHSQPKPPDGGGASSTVYTPGALSQTLRRIEDLPRISPGVASRNRQCMLHHLYEKAILHWSKVEDVVLLDWP